MPAGRLAANYNNNRIVTIWSSDSEIQIQHHWWSFKLNDSTLSSSNKWIETRPLTCAASRANSKRKLNKFLVSNKSFFRWLKFRNITKTPFHQHRFRATWGTKQIYSESRTPQRSRFRKVKFGKVEFEISKREECSSDSVKCFQMW